MFGVISWVLFLIALGVALGVVIGYIDDRRGGR